MDKSLYESFYTELTQIKDYIKHIEQVNNIAKIEVNIDSFKEFDTHYKTFEKDKKTFEYKAIIISLYGLIEKYIELWVQEYLNCISKLIPYNKLANTISEKHFVLSLKLINIIIEGRSDKYKNLKKDTILNNLNNCTVAPQNYKFNTAAFIIQSGNLKHTRIEEIFKNIDIPIGKLLIKDKDLIDAIGINTLRISNTEPEVLFSKLNEIVDRRNTIAHGGIIDNILSLPEIEPYIEFLEKYCIAIFNILEELFVKSHIVEQFNIIELINVFKQKTINPIIAFSIENYKIKIGDFIIIETSEGHFYMKEIKSLQVNNTDYTELIIEQKTEVGLSIENRDELLINKQCKFYLKRNILPESGLV